MSSRADHLEAAPSGGGATVCECEVAPVEAVVPATSAVVRALSLRPMPADGELEELQPEEESIQAEQELEPEELPPEDVEAEGDEAPEAGEIELAEDVIGDGAGAPEDEAPVAEAPEEVQARAGASTQKVGAPTDEAAAGGAGGDEAPQAEKRPAAVATEFSAETRSSPPSSPSSAGGDGAGRCQAEARASSTPESGAASEPSSSDTLASSSSDALPSASSSRAWRRSWEFPGGGESPEEGSPPRTARTDRRGRPAARRLNFEEAPSASYLAARAAALRRSSSSIPTLAATQIPATARRAARWPPPGPGFGSGLWTQPLDRAQPMDAQTRAIAAAAAAAAAASCRERFSGFTAFPHINRRHLSHAISGSQLRERVDARRLRTRYTISRLQAAAGAGAAGADCSQLLEEVHEATTSESADGTPASRAPVSGGTPASRARGSGGSAAEQAPSRLSSGLSASIVPTPSNQSRVLSQSPAAKMGSALRGAASARVPVLTAAASLGGDSLPGGSLGGSAAAVLGEERHLGKYFWRGAASSWQMDSMQYRTQGGLCATCGRRLLGAQRYGRWPLLLEGLWLANVSPTEADDSRRYRRCYYSGKLYCPACHTGQRHIIPANVVTGWDFEPRPVSNEAYRFLEKACALPYVDYRLIHPVIKSIHEELTYVHLLRRDVIALTRFFTWTHKNRRTLAAPAAKCTYLFCLHILEDLGFPGPYWLQSSDKYSINDLAAIRKYKEEVDEIMAAAAAGGKGVVTGQWGRCLRLENCCEAPLATHRDIGAGGGDGERSLEPEKETAAGFFFRLEALDAFWEAHLKPASDGEMCATCAEAYDVYCQSELQGENLAANPSTLFMAANHSLRH